MQQRPAKLPHASNLCVIQHMHVVSSSSGLTPSAAVVPCRCDATLATMSRDGTCGIQATVPLIEPLMLSRLLQGLQVPLHHCLPDCPYITIATACLLWGNMAMLHAVYLLNMLSTMQQQHAASYQMSVPAYSSVSNHDCPKRACMCSHVDSDGLVNTQV